MTLHAGRSDRARLGRFEILCALSGFLGQAVLMTICPEPVEVSPPAPPILAAASPVARCVAKPETPQVASLPNYLAGWPQDSDHADVWSALNDSDVDTQDRSAAANSGLRAPGPHSTAAFASQSPAFSCADRQRTNAARSTSQIFAKSRVSDLRASAPAFFGSPPLSSTIRLIADSMTLCR